MADGADAPAKVQEAVFRTTFLFERILWLARDTASCTLAGASAPSAIRRARTAS